MKKLIFFLLFSSNTFAGFNSAAIDAKLKSMKGKTASIEYKGKRFEIPKDKIENVGSAVSGQK